MKHSFLTVMLCIAVLATGCDAFRRLAGRPTSAEIEAKKEAIIAAREALHQARLDSLHRVEKQMADSLAVLDSLKDMKVNLTKSSDKGGLISSVLEHRYYVVLGSFMDKANAKGLCEKVEKHGYTPTLINFRNGYTVVGVCPSDSIVPAFESLKKIKEEKFCPEDVWVLVN